MNPRPTALPQRAAAFLAQQARPASRRRALVGLDGFVDEIISVVAKRESADKFTRVPTLAAMGRRISAAAGKSTNIELVVERVKLGGNGPIMANALAAFTVQVTYLGNLGYPTLHPVFQELADRATVHSIAEPARTEALEFADGKIMLGKHASLRDVSWPNLLARVGRDKLAAAFRDADLIGLQNWTMLPHMSDIWERILAEICPSLPAQPRRMMFFDLADPEKRNVRDLKHALDLISRFQQYGDVHLGLNEKEAFQIGNALGYRSAHEGEPAVDAVARFIHRKLQTSGVVVHPRAYAVAVSAAGLVKVKGPFVARPRISTGAGDHFNAGYCLGKLLGAEDAIALQLGVATSGYYVRTAKSPTLRELVEFLEGPCR